MAKGEYKEARRESSNRKFSHLEVRPAKNGGHTVTHHFESDGMQYHKPQDHVFGADEGDMALSHIAKHAKINVTGRGEKDEEEESEEG